MFSKPVCIVIDNYVLQKPIFYVLSYCVQYCDGSKGLVRQCYSTVRSHVAQLSVLLRVFYLFIYLFVDVFNKKK